MYHSCSSVIQSFCDTSTTMVDTELFRNLSQIMFDLLWNAALKEVKAPNPVSA